MSGNWWCLFGGFSDTIKWKWVKFYKQKFGVEFYIFGVYLGVEFYVDAVIYL